jgi:tight adherence protein B
MQFVIGTFVLVFGIVAGIYWAFIDRPDAQEALLVRRRLRKASSPSVLIKALLNEPRRLSDLGVLDRMLSSSGRFVRPLQRLIEQSGLNVTVGVVFLSCLVAGTIAFALVFVYLRLTLLAIPFALLGAYAPIGIIRFIRDKRMIKFDEQFPEAMDLLARALRAGHALTTGLSMVSEELPDPIGPEFKLLYDQQNFGLPMPQALRNFADRIPSIDAKFFVTAVLTQRESGGNLSEVLDNLASIIRDRFKVKRQVRVISAHGRITGWVLSALPASLALLFATTSPGKYRDFYMNPLGMQMIAFGLLLQLVGVLIIRKIVKIEY